MENFNPDLKLTVVANIMAKDGKVELVKEELLKLTKATRAEKGCIQYDLSQDNENPAHFLYFEYWSSRKAWLDHMETEHIKSFKEATKNALNQFNVDEMTHLN